MAVNPICDATSLLDGILWSPADPLVSPCVCGTVRPLLERLPIRWGPNGPIVSEWGRSGAFAGEGDVGGSGNGNDPIESGNAAWAGVDAEGTKPNLNGFTISTLLVVFVDASTTRDEGPGS